MKVEKNGNVYEISPAKLISPDSSTAKDEDFANHVKSYFENSENYKKSYPQLYEFFKQRYP